MGKVDFNKLMWERINKMEEGMRPTLMLHCCCAPCASSVLERLAPHFRIFAYFYNPNILSAKEYEKRAAGLSRLISRMPGLSDVSAVIESYVPQDFLNAIKGHEDDPERGARCSLCFEIRLSKTAHMAYAKGCDFFATTLTLSPLKDAATINGIGFSVESGRKGMPEYLCSDFKKNDGFLRSIRLSEQYGLYRQDYCGCAFSARGRA